jgi:ribosomal protein L3 glutamine methyltransferase
MARVTIRDELVRAAIALQHGGVMLGHGNDDVLMEAQALILPTLGLPIDTPDRYFDARLDKTQRQAVRAIVTERITTRKPAAYLTHKAWFCGLEFYVDERVLVPRSPIAELINARFSPWLGDKDHYQLLDLCAGSGCIGIAVAYQFLGSSVDLVDIDTGAIAVQQENIQRHGVADFVTSYQGDVFTPLAGKRYDLIVSNPPYVDAKDMAALHAEYRHEPVIGLAAGEDGLTVVRKILADAAQYLNDDGILVLEVGNSAQALMAAYPTLPFIWPEFKYGGFGVCILGKQDLEAW